MWTKRHHQGFTAGALLSLSVAAWLALWLWGASPYARYLGHHALAEVRGGGFLLLAFTLGWLLMIIAMMLPTSLPLVTVFVRLTRYRQERRLLLMLLLAGYLGVWTLFGGAVYLGDALLHELVHRFGWLEANAWAIAALSFVVAGIYQFTPLKYACLDKCRSPLSFVTEHWRGFQERAQSLWLGVHHGLFCVGCCWSLMLLMFAVGSSSLGWMLVLGLLMAIEKNVPWGKRLSAPLGALLIGWGWLLVFTASPLW